MRVSASNPVMLILIALLTLTLPAAAQAGSPGSAVAPTPTPATTGTASGNHWLPPVTGNEDANTKRAREVLTQMIEALGGQAYMELRTMEIQGLTYSFENGHPASIGVPFWRSWEFPDKDRTEFTKQRDVAYVINGNAGYEITYKGTCLQPPDRWREYVRQREHSLPIVLRVWLNKPGTLILYEGTAMTEQRMTDKVSILNASNDSVTLFVDQITHLPLKKTYTHRNRLDKELDEEGEIFANYRPEQGINTPHTIVTTHNGDYTVQRFYRTVTHNAPLQDSLFQAKVTYDPYALERRLDEQQRQPK